MPKEVRFQFKLPPPSLTKHFPTSYLACGTQPIIFLEFDQAINPEKVLETIQITGANQTFTDFRLATADEIQEDKNVASLEKYAIKGHWMALKITRSLPTNSTITVKIGPNTV